MTTSPAFSAEPSIDEQVAELVRAHFSELGRRGGIAARDRGRLEENIQKARDARSARAALRRAARQARTSDASPAEAEA